MVKAEDISNSVRQEQIIHAGIDRYPNQHQTRYPKHRSRWRFVNIVQTIGAIVTTDIELLSY